MKMNTHLKPGNPYKWHRPHLWFSAALIGWLLVGCQSKLEEKGTEVAKDISIPPDPIKVFASPLRLEPDSTVLHLTDYVWNPEIIGSISCSENIAFSKRGDSLSIHPLSTASSLAWLGFKIQGRTYSIPLFLSRKQKVTLSYSPSKAPAEQIAVKGEFNSWNTAAGSLTKKDGSYSIDLWLEPGSYQYIFVIDGQEKLDPANDSTQSNGMGGFNSVLTVKGAASNEPPAITLKSFASQTVTVQSSVPFDEYVALWQNERMEVGIKPQTANEISVLIPVHAKALKRSFVRIYAASNRLRSNDLIVPLHYGEVVYDANKITRHDHHSKILYNAFVDRFCNGDSSNDRLTAEKILPKANFHGGDIAGVQQKINDGYFSQLGVNTIWMSPVVKNVEGAYGFWPEPKTRFSAYHGYWPVSFTEVDSRFGTSDQLIEMVNTAHQNELNVLVDFVANHVHKEHPYYKAHPDRVTPLYLPDGSLNTERWDDHRLTTWFDVFLPSLDLQNPEVANMLADSVIYWAKTYHLDGFRHDATKHIPHEFWRILLVKMKEEGLLDDNPIYQIGETYGSRDLVGSYVNTGELDAQFDFNLYDDVVAVFAAGESMKRLKAGLLKSLDAFGHHHLMGNISGNQDRARFFSYADGSIRFDEDAKAAGWTRNIVRKDSAAYHKLALLFAFNFSVPGVPVIYYGDEIGMPGGNDPDNRRMMRFEHLSENESWLKNTVSKLADIRKSNLALLYGSTQVLSVDENTLVLERKYFDQTCVIIINNSGTEHFTYGFQESLKPNFTQGNDSQVVVPPYSFEILTSK